MVIRRKKQKQCLPGELEVGDCWIGVSLADSSGLILAARVGKHTDDLIEELVVSSEGKTVCKQWNSDDWGGYERVLPPEILHYIGNRQDATVRAHQWHCQAANWALASQAEQVWKSMGTNESNDPISGELLQLDLVTQSVEDNSSLTSGIDIATLGLARPSNLSHHHLRHNQIFLNSVIPCN